MPRETGGGGGQSSAGEGQLTRWVNLWKESRDEIDTLRDDIRKAQDLIDGTDNPGERSARTQELNRLKREVQELRREQQKWGSSIRELVRSKPRLYDEAVDLGFDNFGDWSPSGSDGSTGGGSTDSKDGGRGSGEDPTGTETGTTSGSGGGGGRGRDDDPTKPDLRDNARNARMLGEKGKDWDVVRGPKGSYVIRFKFKIQGEVVNIGLRVGKDSLSRYGIKQGEGKLLTKEQMKRVQNIGWADELAPHIKKGDKHVLTALNRSLENQYEGQSILRNDEVMSVIIANSLKGWSSGEFENQLRNTKWYRNTNEHQRNWVLVTSEKQRQDTIGQFRETIQNRLEALYGADWQTHVEGGLASVDRWAKQIASGRWGTPGEGLNFWEDRQFDKAKQIEGTPAYWNDVRAQEELGGLANRPEDMFETLRSQADHYLGDDLRPDREILMGWASDLVSNKKSDADWQQYLRQQAKTLHPWKDENTAWRDVASPFRAIIENELGTAVPWTDQLLSKIAGDGAPLSAHEFKLVVRQDARAWQDGTRLHDDAISTVAQLQDIFSGGS